MYALTECQGGQIILTSALSSKISCYTSWWIDFTIVKWIWKLVQICNLAIWHVHCPSFDNCNKYNWKFAEIHFAFDCALSQKISCYTSWLGKPCFGIAFETRGKELTFCKVPNRTFCTTANTISLRFNTQSKMLNIQGGKPFWLDQPFETHTRLKT